MRCSTEHLSEGISHKKADNSTTH